MANTLSIYDPLFYAQEALIALEKSLGMAARVVRGYDKSPQQRGSVVAIRIPSIFQAQDAPSVAQAIQASQVQITLSKWKEVKFSLTDKELTYTTDLIIQEHIRPAAYAIADQIDQDLVGLYKDIGWYTDATSPSAIAVTDLTKVRQVLFNNRNPMGDGNLHVMVDGSTEAQLLALQAFSQFQGAGPLGVDTQLRGNLGTRFGMEFFSNQNTPSGLTDPTIADSVGALSASYAQGATQITIGSMTANTLFPQGLIFTIAGDTQQYTLSGAFTTDGSGNLNNATISPPLDTALAAGAVVTFVPKTAAHVENLAFHQGAFALAMAPLSDIGNNIGARIATVDDPVTGLTLRSRIFYLGDASSVNVAIDVLYGVKTLNPNRAVRFRV
jgi:hypothetical protein